MAVTTEIGKELRKLRIDRDERLNDMAQKLGASASFISAVEVGGKSPPAGFEQKVIATYGLDADASERLCRAADRSRRAFTLEPKSAQARDTAALFARKINSLSADDLFGIQEILKKKAGDQ